MSDAGEAYPFESDDDIEITELDLESVDTFGESRITVGQMVSEHQSWRFGHVIVDEAQDLTPMEWRMVMRRAKARSITVVGDVAQTTRGGSGTWLEHLPRELAHITRQDLTINYRSPAEINDVATVVLADIAPDVPPSLALRRSGEPVTCSQVASLADGLPSIVSDVVSAQPGRVGIIVADVAAVQLPDELDADLIVLSPANAKGLEFDTVIVVEPASILALQSGAAHLYVALTRATRRMLIVHEQPLPDVVQRAVATSS